MMKDKLLNHLVSFRYGTLTLYGEILYVSESEEGTVYMIQAGGTLYKEIPLNDILMDFGKEE